MEQNPAGECDSRVGSQISVLHKNWLYITGLTKDRRWSVTSHMNAVYIHRMLMSAVLITLLWRWDHYAVSKRRVPYHRWRGFTCQNNWYLMHIHLFSSLSYDRSKKPLPKRAVHIVRCRASSFKWEYPLLSLRSSSSSLHLLPVTSVPPSLGINWLASCLCCFAFQETTSGSPRLGGRVGPAASLDSVEGKKYLVPPMN